VQAPSGAPTPEAIEREVLDNVKHQPLGTGTVEDLAMPDDFLRRVADRVIRASFEERYRIVVKDDSGTRSAPSSAVLYGGIVAVALVIALLVARMRR
jgi:hypothetical protein